LQQLFVSNSLLEYVDGGMLRSGKICSSLSNI
jgi:hypothetical protein